MLLPLHLTNLLATRHNSARGGLFWPRLLAMWPNYRNAEVRVRRGFVTDTFTIYDLKTEWVGRLDSVLIDSRGLVTIKAGDRLRPYVTRKLPAAISSSNTLQTTISRSATSLVVADAAQVTDPTAISGVVVIEWTNGDGSGSEKMIVTARDTATDTLTVTRAAYGTTACWHAADETFKEVLHYSDATGAVGLPFTDVALDIINRCGVPGADINTSAIYAEADYLSGMRFKATIREPVEANALLFELGEACGFGNWCQDESGRATFTLNRPPRPVESVETIEDEPHVLHNTAARTTNEESRLTHVSLWFDAEDTDSTSASGDSSNYTKRVAVINGETYVSNYYGSGEDDRLEKEIKTRWFNDMDHSIPSIPAIRWCNRHAQAPNVYRWEAELRHADLRIGQIIDLEIGETQAATGAVATRRCRVIRKEWKENGAGCVYTARELSFHVLATAAAGGTRTPQYVYLQTDSAADYDSASADDLLHGYLADDSDTLGTANANAHLVF